MDIILVLCHVSEWCVQSQICLYNFIFGKHHIKMYKYIYFLITEVKDYWTEDGQIKKIGANVGKVVYIYIKDKFKAIFPLYLTWYFVKFLVPMIDSPHTLPMFLANLHLWLRQRQFLCHLIPNVCLYTVHNSSSPQTSKQSITLHVYRAKVKVAITDFKWAVMP
jgi:hypothetical protein